MPLNTGTRWVAGLMLSSLIGLFSYGVQKIEKLSVMEQRQADDRTMAAQERLEIRDLLQQGFTRMERQQDQIERRLDRLEFPGYAPGGVFRSRSTAPPAFQRGKQFDK